MKRWPIKPLLEVCSPKQWPTISTAELTDSGFPVYGANGQIGHYHGYNHEEPVILITCRGATCGTLNISPPRAYVTGNAMALDNLRLDIINFKFFYYALVGRGLGDTITGTAQPQITRTSLSHVSVPIPPLAEQERIVKLLEEADELRKLRVLADRRTADLIPALFHEMFGRHVKSPSVPVSLEGTSAPKGWVWSRLTDVARLATGHTPSRRVPEYWNGTIPWISLTDIRALDGTVAQNTSQSVTELGLAHK